MTRYHLKPHPHNAIRIAVTVGTTIWITQMELQDSVLLPPLLLVNVEGIIGPAGGRVTVVVKFIGRACWG